MVPVFVDTYFEGATPLRWEQEEEGVIDLYVIHDHARFSPNQQFTQWDFKVHIPPERIGSSVRLRFARLNNCWNGRPSPAMKSKRVTSVVSYDGSTWLPLLGIPSETAEFAIEFELDLRSESTHFAHVVPYTDSRLQQRLNALRPHPSVRIYDVGATVDGRPLEMVELGNTEAPNRIFLRARAHPWETGGSWLLDGLMTLLTDDTPTSRAILETTCFCLMPMSNKDGVHRGMTRFNVKGIDLNRGWGVDTPHDPELVPENACLQNWFSEQRRAGRLPQMAICVHNDDNGRIHPSHPSIDPAGYAARLERFEGLLREETWFTEGMVGGSYRNSGTFGEGVTELYGADAFIWELNARWAEGLGRQPMHTDWQQMGANLATVVQRYFKADG
ncbi:MAG: hypothetical protein HN742_37935 [Lentisphaerae bacterium]|jgi:hypothetical protein|nr:hypothetical protein [Lentisphaerota bacterium]MBT4820519.1 hypothetical protein [Lentisphaerota bacterium]MBT5608113.1 hypothetical protein [Lentisphaerota bacterium]MBT7060610.1 hypothetical protein [Lentisphaerota bacterium]MBT7847709.1 hypothetical protein [Lentisphaerota bacterium]